MTVQSSVSYHPYNMAARGKKLTFETVRFIKFIITEIFPGGRLPSTEMMVEHGEKAGFIVPEPLSLRPHYIKTLRIWGDTLESNRDKAIEVTSEEVYDRYMKYLRGCEHYFDYEILDCQPGDLPQAGCRRLAFRFRRGRRIRPCAVRRIGREWSTGLRSLPEVTTNAVLRLVDQQGARAHARRGGGRDGGLPSLSRQGGVGDSRR